MTTIDRRTLLAGSAGLLLAACGGGSPDPKKTKGPNIVKPNAGTVVTTEDTAALRKRLNAAFEARDVEQLIKIIDPDDFALDEVRERWARRFDNFKRLDFVSGEWFVGVPSGRTRNAAGGQVEYSGDLVFTHRIKGCDARPVVETYGADFRKKSEDAPLELMHIGDPEARFDPSFWDVAKVDAIETKHAYIAFRTKDAQRAKQYAGQIERGAKRALAMLPTPKGVSKIFYALSWPGLVLWGDRANKEYLGTAYYHPFLDPEELAKGQEVAPPDQGLPKATARVALHQSAFSSSSPLHQTACHEAAHVIAEQWHGSSDRPTWIVEGFARWSEYDKGELLARHRGDLRAYFPAFAAVAPKGYKEFHAAKNEWQYYQCGAAVCAYVEQTQGRDKLFEMVQAFYESPTRADGAKKFGRSEKELVTATRKWLGA